MNTTNFYNKSNKNIKKKIGFGFLVLFLMIVGISLGFVTAAFGVGSLNLMDGHISAVALLLFVGPVLLFLGIINWIATRLGFKLSDFGMK